MKGARDQYTNGEDGAGTGVAGSEGSRGSGSGSDSESEGSGCEELSLVDREAPARALAALNALRKSRQHFDVVLVAGGVEVPAHRAVLAAVSPYLLEQLPAGVGEAAAAPYRVAEVEGDALQALVEYAYTGRLSVRDAAHARRLYLAAWRLRVEAARAHLAARLTSARRLAPAACVHTRALPGLTDAQLQALDDYIAHNFEEVIACGALAALPQVRLALVRESGAGAAAGAAGEEAAVAEAALAWLRDRAGSQRELAELCARDHLVFVDGGGALRDCGELPHATGDAPELVQYRREAQARRKHPPTPTDPTATTAAAAHQRPLPGLELGARAAGAGCAVVAARRAAGGGTRALVYVRGGLCAVSAAWSGVAAGGAPRAGSLGGGERLARLGAGRCAHGAAALAGRLLVCGGYDRARVLRSAEEYDPAANAWAPAADMRRERARFPAARLGAHVYALGGSDGHVELDSVDAYTRAEGWRARARLPLAVSHAAAAADEAGGALYVCGGWAGGAYVRRAWRYDPVADAWAEAASLATARAQAAAVHWRAAVWVLGGCDAWHCLASTERLATGEGEAAQWEAGPALPTARRSMGGAVWGGRLVAAGGSDGAASLRRTDWLETEGGEWATGPSLRRARAGPGLAVLADTLYAAGGFDGKEFLACAECLSRPDGEWTALCASPAPAPPLPHTERQPSEGAVSDSGAVAAH